jgi:LysM repeat protein
MARSYGASNTRIITRYLVPRILPVMIPYLVLQIPFFIFLEATLGFFNIRSYHPSWGRIIYEGLTEGALYGSPFWVLEPIFLLLLTGLAFAMLGSALERILNPRMIADMPAASKKPKQAASRRDRYQSTLTALNWKIVAGLLVALIGIGMFTPVLQGSSLASVFMAYFDLSRKPSPMHPATLTPTFSQPVILPEATATPVPSADPSLTPTPTEAASLTVTITPTWTAQEPALITIATDTPPETHTLQRGEYPYCIARRFDVHPGELLALNGMSNRDTFLAGTVLRIPQTGRPFPGERMQKTHPAVYTVSRPDETIYTIACGFGDVEPLAIAEANDLPLDAGLSVGQQLMIP